VTRRLFAAVGFAILVLACAAFVRANAVPVTFDLLFAPIEVDAGTALVVAFVAGWALGLGGALLYGLRLVRERARLRRDLRLAEAEARLLRVTAPAHAR
jgi:membrane protein YqaA with SNARE-associated domain